MTSFGNQFLERERERMEEKRQRIEDRKQKMTTAPTTVAPKDKAENEHHNEVKAGGEKTLKIEVHATAMHHQEVEPIVAHSLSHEISHGQAVSSTME